MRTLRKHWPYYRDGGDRTRLAACGKYIESARIVVANPEAVDCQQCKRTNLVIEAERAASR